MKMKKVIGLLLTLVMVLSLGACGNSETDDSASPSGGQEQDNAGKIKRSGDVYDERRSVGRRDCH